MWKFLFVIKTQIIVQDEDLKGLTINKLEAESIKRQQMTIELLEIRGHIIMSFTQNRKCSLASQAQDLVTPVWVLRHCSHPHPPCPCITMQYVFKKMYALLQETIVLCNLPFQCQLCGTNICQMSLLSRKQYSCFCLI